MPILQVQLLAGRPRRVKAELAERLTRVVVETLGTEPSAVRVLLHDVPVEDWFVGGRSLAGRGGRGHATRSRGAGAR